MRAKGRSADAELQALSVAGGLDMSQKYDLTAFVATFKEPLDEVQRVDVIGRTSSGRR
jgi:uncharacterized tellurite resistance protein B-like protein